MTSYPKHINHELSPMECPVDLDTVDLFGEGAQEHWYRRTRSCIGRPGPAHRGWRHDAAGTTFVLTKHADVARRQGSRAVHELDAGADRWLRRQGLSAEETYATLPNLMYAAMVSCARRKRSTSATAGSSRTHGSGRGRCAIET